LTSVAGVALPHQPLLKRRLFEEERQVHPGGSAYYEEHAESVELWSPGSAVFKAPESLGEAPCSADSLRDILAKATGT